MDATRTKPTVFVSSTCLDLKQIREDVKEFLDSNYGFNTILQQEVLACLEAIRK